MLFVKLFYALWTYNKFFLSSMKLAHLTLIHIFEWHLFPSEDIIFVLKCNVYSQNRQSYAASTNIPKYQWHLHKGLILPHAKFFAVLNDSPDVVFQVIALNSTFPSIYLSMITREEQERIPGLTIKHFHWEVTLFTSPHMSLAKASHIVMPDFKRTGNYHPFMFPKEGN